MIEPCRIIGVLDDGTEGLTAKVLSHLRRADLVIGASRTLGLVAGHLGDGARTRELMGNLAGLPDRMREARARGERVVVLATGDPLCHGIAGFLRTQLDAEEYEVLPNLSLIQLTCARLGLPWQEMKICSVHDRDAGEWHQSAGPDHGLYPILRALARHDLVGVFTSADNSPSRIARMLVTAGLTGQFRPAVAERLLHRDERLVTNCTLEEAAARRFADPNVLILRRVAPPARKVLFGLNDRSFRQRRPGKGLITKREVRAVSLARMQLRADSIVWDIGAGSGALGLEAACIASAGYVYAIEKNPNDLDIVAWNRRALGVTNHTLVPGKAPAGLETWPDPDAVFIGGSGKALSELIALGLERLRSGGNLVLNLVTAENLAVATAALTQQGATWDLTQIQVSRSRPILDMHRLAAENPVWILCAGKPEHGKTAR